MHIILIYYRYYLILVIIQRSGHCNLLVLFLSLYEILPPLFCGKRNGVVICASILSAFSRFFMDSVHHINRFSFILSPSCILRPNVPPRCNKSEWKVLGYTASSYRMFVKYAGGGYGVKFASKRKIFL